MCIAWVESWHAWDGLISSRCGVGTGLDAHGAVDTSARGVVVPVSVESMGGQMSGAGTSTAVLTEALDKSAGGSEGAVADGGGDLAKRNGCILVDSDAAAGVLVWLAPPWRPGPPT